MVLFLLILGGVSRETTHAHQVWLFHVKQSRGAGCRRFT
jgi:hypothetical protein